MNVLIKLLPVILISIIFYLFIYNIYPLFKDIIALEKKFNQLRDREKEIESLENFVKELEKNQNIKSLLDIKDNLDEWLPKDPKTDHLIYTFFNIYKETGLGSENLNFQVSNQDISFNRNVLPVKPISMFFNFDSIDKAFRFIKIIENNVRIMLVKDISLSKNGEARLSVETYYMPVK
jgi:hypothetical protein